MPQLAVAPKRLGQHVGGMVLSSSPLPDMVPVRPGATHGRFIMDWDKDSVADAKFAKTDCPCRFWTSWKKPWI